jgi:ribosomal protein L7/L12
MDAYDDIRALAREGNLIAAIKLYRERYRTGLAEAKAVVEAIAAGQRPAPSPPSQPSALEDAVFRRQIETLLREGQTIAAIKEYRARYHVGLRAAKDAVDRIAAEMRGY